MANTGAKLGTSCKLYYSVTGVVTGATWVELTNVKDLTLNMERADADVTTRANGGYKARLAALKDVSLEWDMVYNAADAGWQVINDAYHAGTMLGIKVLDQGSTTTGVEGLTANMQVLSMKIAQPLTEAVTASVVAKITYSATVPTWTP